MAKSRVPAPNTAGRIKTLASEAMQRPSTLNAKQVRALGASVMSHIEPRSNNKAVCAPRPKRK